MRCLRITIAFVFLVSPVTAPNAGGLFGDGGLIRGDVGNHIDKNIEKPILSPILPAVPPNPDDKEEPKTKIELIEELKKDGVISSESVTYNGCLTSLGWCSTNTNNAPRGASCYCRIADSYEYGNVAEIRLDE